MALKNPIREFCKTCGVRMGEMYRDVHGQGRIKTNWCECPHPPGPLSPPRSFSMRNAYLIRADGTEVFEMPAGE